MRLLHTADLHLGLCRGNISRWDDHMRVLNEILACVDEYQVEVLLFVGDVFNDRTKRSLPEIAAEFLHKLVPILSRGIDVVLVSGNHDSQDLFHLMGTLLQEVGGQDSLPLLVCHRPGVYDLLSHRELQLIALPYMPPNSLRGGGAFPSSVMEGSELNQTLGATIESGLQWLEKQIDSNRPAVFAGHILVTGSQAATGIELNYANDIAIAPQSLPHYTQYNALGHIHLCQEISGASRPSWYSGAPDRQDMGERAYTPQMLLVNLTMKPGEPCEPVKLPVKSATPFIDKSLDGAKGIAELMETGLSQDTMGRVRLACAVDEWPDLRAQLLSQSPRLEVVSNLTDETHPIQVELTQDPYNVHANVLAYLDEQFTGSELEHLKAAFVELYGEAAS